MRIDPWFPRDPLRAVFGQHPATALLRGDRPSTELPHRVEILTV